MLELRPSCEHCNKPLPAASPEARICSFECTFCASCVGTVLGNVCPNCGGGFVARPVRPARPWKGASPLGESPASTRVKHRPVDVVAHAAMLAALNAAPDAPPVPASASTPAETVLVPMPAEAYAAYAESSAAGYAEDNIASGRWPEEGALERSRAEFEALLPQGLATPDNHVHEIKAAQGGPTVGALWFAVQARDGVRSAYVYDVFIQPEHRRQGHARRAFLALEPLAAAMGATHIGLHVFGHNLGAQALYRQLGYGVTGTNLKKRLVGPG